MKRVKIGKSRSGAGDHLRPKESQAAYRASFLIAFIIRFLGIKARMWKASVRYCRYLSID